MEMERVYIWNKILDIPSRINSSNCCKKDDSTILSRWIVIKNKLLIKAFRQRKYQLDRQTWKTFLNDTQSESDNNVKIILLLKICDIVTWDLVSFL